jgi:hypothetical protein
LVNEALRWSCPIQLHQQPKSAAAFQPGCLDSAASEHRFRHYLSAQSPAKPTRRRCKTAAGLTASGVAYSALTNLNCFPGRWTRTVSGRGLIIENPTIATGTTDGDLHCLPDNIGGRAMRRVLFAAVATVALSAPFLASADEVTIRDKPNGNVVIRDQGGPPGPAGDTVVREHPNGSVTIREHDGPRDSVTIKER